MFRVVGQGYQKPIEIRYWLTISYFKNNGIQESQELTAIEMHETA